MADKSVAGTLGKAIGTGVCAVASAVASQAMPFASVIGNTQGQQSAAGREAAHAGSSYESGATSGQGEK